MGRKSQNSILVCTLKEESTVKKVIEMDTVFALKYVDFFSYLL